MPRSLALTLLVVWSAGCAHLRFRSDCEQGDGVACRLVVQDLLESDRREEATAYAWAAVERLLVQCRNGWSGACFDAEALASALDAPRHYGESAGPHSAAMLDHLCTKGLAGACRSLARASLAGGVVPESRDEALRYLRAACTFPTHPDCAALERPELLLKGLSGAAARAYLERQLQAILEEHGAGKPDASRARLLSLLAYGPVLFESPPEIAAAWVQVVDLFWDELVEQPYADGQRWLALGRANALSSRVRGPRGTRAAALRIEIGEAHLASAWDTSRPDGSRNFHAKLASHLLANQARPGARALGLLVAETSPLLARPRLAFRTTNDACRHALPPDDASPAFEVRLDFRSCRWSQETKTVRTPITKTLTVPPKTETTTSKQWGMRSVAGCGPDGYMSCYGDRDVTTTRVLAPGRTEQRVVGHRDVHRLHEDIDVSANATLSGPGVFVSRLLDHKVARTREVKVAWAPVDGTRAMQEELRRLVERRFSNEFLKGALHTGDAAAARALDSDDPQDWEDALVRALFTTSDARRVLLERCAGALGMPPATLEAALKAHVTEFAGAMHFTFVE